MNWRMGLRVMIFKSDGATMLRAAAVILIGATLAACQSSTDGLDVSQSEKDNSDLERVSFEELRGYCPRVQLRDGTAYFNTYDGEESSQNVRYQASITDVSRQCKYENGRLAMTVAVAGRVLLGPKGSSGTVQLPIRVAALKGDEVLYSEIKPFSVDANTSGATQFIYTDTGVSIDQPDARNILIYAGFDEGPKKGRAATN
ncbi:hypothetical protein [Notoacmeibacter sp. MSK16QG-6]|uniref:hypothetical protein n=1 Tax=Notoacmeibacter sp. MSK16QG-6 TaxID=2957982 RepID=UPI00209F2DAD|nr:hypothetical protein [Notoacmeibacter sp. MSK16QG-6]MCP1198210.1 hypothetical protein [Notoacmeibacter sp. MSK16QG-6]